MLVAYTVNTLGKELEHECQGLEALGFPLPASVRLPLTEQQDVRRLDAFDCFEEEPLQEVEVRHPDGQTSGLVGGSVLKGGGLERNPSRRSRHCRVRGVVEPKAHARPAASTVATRTAGLPTGHRSTG